MMLVMRCACADCDEEIIIGCLLSEIRASTVRRSVVILRATV